MSLEMLHESTSCKRSCSFVLIDECRFGTYVFRIVDEHGTLYLGSSAAHQSMNSGASTNASGSDLETTSFASLVFNLSALGPFVAYLIGSCCWFVDRFGESCVLEQSSKASLRFAPLLGEPVAVNNKQLPIHCQRQLQFLYR